MSSQILTQSSNTNDSTTFFKRDYGNTNYKDRIILSQKLKNTGADNQTTINAIMITQNNIKNNIKFIHSSNNTNRKILFIKNQNTSDNSKNYLLNNIVSTRTTSFYHLNYYFNNYFNNIANYKDYFNISIKDFIYKDNSANSDIDFISTRFRIRDFSSIPLFSNSSTDISLINYVASDFSSLFIKTGSHINASINNLNFDSSYIINTNIYSYNKLTLDFKNVNTYNFDLYNSSGVPIQLNANTLYTNYNRLSTITTFMIKTNNFDILNARKSNSKIIFDKNNIYLNNVRALDVCSNFYIANHNPYYKNSTRLTNTIFLSLGKKITGITQYDLYNNIHIVSKNASIFDISKIVFSKNINSSLLSYTNTKYNTLVTSKNNPYLLDFTFNYKNTNYNNNNINNAINYNASLYNYIEYKNKKQFEFNLSKIIDFSYINVNSSTNKYYTNNPFINNVNNLLAINNKDLSTIVTASYEVMNNALRFKFKDLNYDNTIYNLNNAITIESDLYSSIVNYDVRYNYGNYFITTTKLDILLQDNSNSNVLNLNKNYPFNYPLIGSYDNSYSRINFYSLQVVNIFILTIGSDFENVDCIFVYHDPATETDPSFLYPYNNIEIKRDTGIDTLEKAIIVLPGARTSTTNSTFIPAKNGSNLSRKMIQGLIGMNNVPKLLSIVPYDNNFINGRGFVTQYQIGDTCNDNEALIKNKINAIKHYSAKDNATTPNNTLKNENYANIVRSSARSRLSQNCIANLRANLAAGTQNTTTTTTRPVITPFRLFG
jgi:hypothetical protein